MLKTNNYLVTNPSIRLKNTLKSPQNAYMKSPIAIELCRHEVESKWWMQVSFSLKLQFKFSQIWRLKLEGRIEIFGCIELDVFAPKANAGVAELFAGEGRGIRVSWSVFKNEYWTELGECALSCKIANKI